MPMTLDQSVEETSHRSPEQVAELVDRLTLALHQSAEPEIDDAWKQETRRRVTEIESGRVKGTC
jgi:hypothetical protein